MQQTVNLKAGVRQRVYGAGAYLLLMSVGVATSIQVWLRHGNEDLEVIETAQRGLKCRVPGSYTSVEMQSAVDTAVTFVASDGHVDIDLMAGASVNASIVNPLPVPVSNDRGSPGNPVNVTAVTVNDSPATSITSPAAVVIDDTPENVVVAANANRRAIRFYNHGPDPLTLGPAGHTWAKRCLVLDVGDMWVEERAGNLAWNAVCDVGKTATLGVQEVLA